MPDAPADPHLDPKRTPKIDPGPRRHPGKPADSPNWWFIWWYIPIMLLMLWVWQDQLHRIPVKTIPYSQFKHYLAAGEVAECKIMDLEITGRIVPRDVHPYSGRRPPRRASRRRRSRLRRPVKRATQPRLPNRLPARPKNHRPPPGRLNREGERQTNAKGGNRQGRRK